MTAKTPASLLCGPGVFASPWFTGGRTLWNRFDDPHCIDAEEGLEQSIHLLFKKMLTEPMSQTVMARPGLCSPHQGPTDWSFDMSRFAQSWRVAEPGCGSRSFCFQDADSFHRSPAVPNHLFKIHYFRAPKAGMKGVWPHCSGFLIFSPSFAITTRYGWARCLHLSSEGGES